MTDLSSTILSRIQTRVHIPGGASKVRMSYTLLGETWQDKETVTVHEPAQEGCYLPMEETIRRQPHPGSFTCLDAGRGRRDARDTRRKRSSRFEPFRCRYHARDLAVPISKENAAFVHKKTRRALLSKLKQARKLCGLDVKPEAWKRFLASAAL